MKVILLHPATYNETDIPEAVRMRHREDMILLSGYSPLGQAVIMDFDFVEWVDWLRQMDESIQALNGR
jgi:hypothetical protein